MRALVLASLIALTACSGGPAVRKALAQCQMDKRAQYDFGGPNDIFIGNCMQAKGFVNDDDLMVAGCAGPADSSRDPWIEPKCYRPDNWRAALVANIRAKLSQPAN